MNDLSGSADRAANYPAFPTAQDDATASRAPKDAALPPSRPGSTPPPSPPDGGAGMVRIFGRVIDMRLFLVILLLGAPLLAFCIVAGR